MINHSKIYIERATYVVSLLKPGKNGGILNGTRYHRPYGREKGFRT